MDKGMWRWRQNGWKWMENESCTKDKVWQSISPYFTHQSNRDCRNRYRNLRISNRVQQSPTESNRVQQSPTESNRGTKIQSQLRSPCCHLSLSKSQQDLTHRSDAWTSWTHGRMDNGLTWKILTKQITSFVNPCQFWLNSEYLDSS